MLPRIVLIALQIIIGLLAGGWVADTAINALGARDFNTIISAVVYAVIVWIVGLAGSGVLKGLQSPSFGTFLVAAAVALVTGIVLLIGPVNDAVGSIVSFQQIPVTVFPLLGAILGYWIKT